MEVNPEICPSAPDWDFIIVDVETKKIATVARLASLYDASRFKAVCKKRWVKTRGRFPYWSCDCNRGAAFSPPVLPSNDTCLTKRFIVVGYTNQPNYPRETLDVINREYDAAAIEAAFEIFRNAPP